MVSFSRILAVAALLSSAIISYVHADIPKCFRRDVNVDHYKFLGLLTLDKSKFTEYTKTFAATIDGDLIEASFDNLEGINHWTLTSTSSDARNYKFQFRLRNGQLPAYSIGSGGTICHQLADKLGPFSPTPDEVYGINIFEY